MQRYAKIRNGEINRLAPRPKWLNDDGEDVGDDVLAQAGWIPVVDERPEFDPEVEVVERLPMEDWTVESEEVRVVYNVRLLTPEEAEERARVRREGERTTALSGYLQQRAVAEAEAEVQDEETPLSRVQELAPIFPDWEPDVEYPAGKVLYWHGQAVRVRQAHTSQEQFPPGPETVALYWIYREEGSVEPWQQPGGEIPPYMVGERATHNERLWESNIDHNVWEPGSPGAETLWTDLGPA